MKTELAVAVALVALATSPAMAQAPAAFTDTCRVDTAQPQARLTGKVTDAAGKPVPGASLTLACGAFKRTARSVGDGSYEFAAPTGTYQVDVEAPGFLPWAETVVLKSPGGGQRTFKLAEGRFSSIVTVTAV